MNEAHLRAVLLMIAGENVAAVSAQSGICRTSFQPNPSQNLSQKQGVNTCAVFSF
jgi:hypothetical protein